MASSKSTLYRLLYEAIVMASKLDILTEEERRAIIVNIAYSLVFASGPKPELQFAPSDSKEDSTLRTYCKITDDDRSIVIY
jgi:hypothetical protein